MVFTEVILCNNALLSYEDRNKLWNAVQTIEKGKNAQLAREVRLALPRELNRRQQIDLIHNYVSAQFIRAGMRADIAIHDKGDGNPHAHILLTMRPINDDGRWGAKCRKEYLLDKSGQRIPLPSGAYKSRRVNATDWNAPYKAEQWRAAWAECCNRYLAPENHIDNRSYERQGIERVPTIHEGFTARKIERGGGLSDRMQRNRDVRAANLALETLQREVIRLKQILKTVKKRAEKVARSVADRVFRDERESGPIKLDSANLSFDEMLERFSREKHENYAENRHSTKENEIFR